MTPGNKEYDVVCMGGTFNILHIGHKTLLKRGFDLGKKVIIGITSNDMAAESRTVGVRDYQDRKNELESWLRSMGYHHRSDIREIHDPYGPAVEASECQAIVVSTETMFTAEKINKIRKEEGLKPLAIHVIPMVKSEDGTRLKSTRVVLGIHTPYGSFDRELIFSVGSSNRAKIRGVIESIKRVFLSTNRASKGAHVVAGHVEHKGVAQPIGIDTLHGAVERATLAFNFEFTGDAKCYYLSPQGRLEDGKIMVDDINFIDFAIGIEAGILPINNDYIGSQYTAIIDKDGVIGIGHSGGFTLPEGVIKEIKESGTELEKAMYKIYHVRGIGDTVGAIGILSDGLITRDEVTEQSTSMAFIRWCRNYNIGDE